MPSLQNPDDDDVHAYTTLHFLLTLFIKTKRTNSRFKEEVACIANEIFACMHNSHFFEVEAKKGRNTHSLVYYKVRNLNILPLLHN